MPIPIPPAGSSPSFELFPPLSKAKVDAARTSAWYDLFEDITIPSTIISLREIDEEEAFIHYDGRSLADIWVYDDQWLESDSIFLPEHSEGPQDPPPSSSSSLATPAPASAPAPTTSRPRSSSTSSASSASSSSSSSSSSVPPVYRLPKLNAAIRSALRKHDGAVFPKLNWTSPKDAACILPQAASGPLHCTSPADVYLLLKSSDFITFDLDPHRAYEGVEYMSDPQHEQSSGTGIELVLKRFEDVNPSREVRCFVRNKALIGITQRDINFYDHLQSEETRTKICDTVRAFWEDEIRENYVGGDDYVFDLYLTPNLLSAKIIDFQPYRASTDPLLFTYDELLSILEEAFEPLDNTSGTIDSNTEPRPRLPIFRVIDSPAHPQATRAAPAYQSSMLPLEMIEMSQGRNMAEFKEAWDEAFAAGMAD